jgi:DUF1680 family protein
LLLDQALQWTGEAKYAAEIERDLFNHFLAAQLADGSNWSYMTALNGKAQEPWGPNCCNASGHRIAGRMPTYLYGLRDGGPAVFIFTESEASLELSDQTRLTIQQETDYPSHGQVKLTLQPEQSAEFALHIRIPAFAQGAAYQVNNGSPHEAASGEFLIIERQWQPGDTVTLNLPMLLSVQANQHQAAIVRGPLVYCLFQDLQEKKGTIFWHRGIYPEDNQLTLNLDHLEKSIREEQAREDLLGPALRVDGQITTRAPMFSTSQANQQTLPSESQSYILVPFANQGAIRGPYQIFNNYRMLNESHL